MSTESEIPHDKRFSYQANSRLDMILKKIIIFIFYHNFF